MSELSNIAVNILRDIKRLDPEAFAALVSFRAKVNEKLSAHPNIQVSVAGRSSQMGVVGVLNGILLAAGQPKIATVVDNDTVVGFAVMESETHTAIGVDGEEGVLLRNSPDMLGPEKS